MDAKEMQARSAAKRWAGTTPEERSAKMKAVRSGGRKKTDKRLRYLRAMIDMMEGGDGLIGETPRSRAMKEELRAEIQSLEK